MRVTITMTQCQSGVSIKRFSLGLFLTVTGMVSTVKYTADFIDGVIERLRNRMKW